MLLPLGQGNFEFGISRVIKSLEPFNRKLQAFPYCLSLSYWLLQTRKVDIRLPGKGNSSSHSARPVFQSHLDD